MRTIACLGSSISAAKGLWKNVMASSHPGSMPWSVTACVCGRQSRSMKSTPIGWRQERGLSVTLVLFGIWWLPELCGGQSWSVKSTPIDWRQERSRAVIKGQSGVRWLLGWRRGQSLSMKSSFVNCWIKHDINKSYHQLLSGSIKETALKLHHFIVRAVALAKDELVWLPMEYLLSLVWHCTYAFFHKINCRRIDLSV